jgi:hypothetical protein
MAAQQRQVPQTFAGAQLQQQQAHSPNKTAACTQAD